MAKDGYEADRQVLFYMCKSTTYGSQTVHLHRAEIVLYDLEKNVRTNLTSSWDRSASQLTVRMIKILKIIRFLKCFFFSSFLQKEIKSYSQHSTGPEAECSLWTYSLSALPTPV